MKKTKPQKISLYGFLTAAALLFGYVEYMVPLNFIAPGVKLGFANGVILLLIFCKKYKAAVLVNFSRIILSALLFGSPFSLLFSVTAGVMSMAVMILLAGCRRFGFIGVSVLGAVVHNFSQLCIASLTVGKGVWYYFPFLILAGVIAGVLIGILTYYIFIRVKKYFVI